MDVVKVALLLAATHLSLVHGAKIVNIETMGRPKYAFQTTPLNSKDETAPSYRKLMVKQKASEQIDPGDRLFENPELLPQKRKITVASVLPRKGIDLTHIPTPSRTPVPLSICQNKISICRGNHTVCIRGINLSEFQLPQSAGNGLLQGDTALSQDSVNVLRRIRLLGFNAVRLPFSIPILLSSDTFNQTTGTCKNIAKGDLLASVTKPGRLPLRGNARKEINVQLPNEPLGTRPLLNERANPYLSVDQQKASGPCNLGVPRGGNVYNRFMWYLRLMTYNGFVVVVDNHLNTDPTITNEIKLWVTFWTRLMTDVAKDPWMSANVIFDFLNEPDAENLTWEPNGSQLAGKGMGYWYHKVMSISYSINRRALFMFEGMAQSAVGANWGDGHATDADLMKFIPADANPNKFYQQLVTSPYIRNAIISPHAYGPSVTNANVNTSGIGLNWRLSASFGKKTLQGYKDSTTGQSHRFPAVLGEFGSYLNNPSNPCIKAGCLIRDLKAMMSIRDYVMNTGSGADGQHSAMAGWFWWEWNASSKDTGGLVGSDGHTVQWEKVEYLSGMGLVPWYESSS